MICKQCGLEYPDDLEACPGCHAPNEELEAQPMSEAERDSFDGVTIEAHEGDEAQETYRVYDQEDVKRQQENEAKKEKWQAIWSLIRANVKTVLVIVAILAFLIFVVLPSLIFFVGPVILFFILFYLVNYFLSR